MLFSPVSQSVALLRTTEGDSYGYVQACTSVCIRTDSSTSGSVLVGCSLTQVARFPFIHEAVMFSIEGMRCRGLLLALAVSSRTRRREAANDMMETNDTPKPYNDIQLHSRSGRSTGCADRPACASSGSRSIFVSRRASAPKRTLHNTNLDGGVRLRASSASSRSAWRSLPACPKSCLKSYRFGPDDVRANPLRSITPPIRRRTHAARFYQPVQSVRRMLGHYR